MKHIFKIEKSEEYYCGSHYCDGHIDKYIVCSCGWKIKDTFPYDRKTELEIQKTNHILRTEGFLE